MLPFKRILFPVDFSVQSVGAARFVEAFAGRFNSAVILLHVIDLPHYNDLLPKSPAEKRAHLKSFLAKELEYLHVERITAEGDPAANILRIAREHHADLIMLPTHGLGPFRRFLLGSVTAKILHDADCPVWTGVHLESAPSLENIRFDRLLCAINTESYARKVLAAATELAAEYQAELTVLHVGDPRQKSRVEAQFREIAGPEAVVKIEPGDVTQVVADTARKIEANLLIIGRSPSPGVFGRLRQHAYPIIRQSPCAVISI